MEAWYRQESLGIWAAYSMGGRLLCRELSKAKLVSWLHDNGYSSLIVYSSRVLLLQTN